MKKSITHPIFTPQSLELMLVLRSVGFSVTTLSLFFQCDKKTIRNYCGEYRISPIEIEISVNDAVRKILENQLEDRWVIIEGERINKGNSYATYLKLKSPTRS